MSIIEIPLISKSNLYGHDINHEYCTYILDTTGCLFGNENKIYYQMKSLTFTTPVLKYDLHATY